MTESVFDISSALFYVAHYTPLKERKQHILGEFRRMGITNYELVETHDREALTQEQWDRFINYQDRGEISLFYKHVEIFRRADPNAYTFVLEDDAVFLPNFNHKLELYMEELPKSWDVIFCAECARIRAEGPITESQIYYPSNRSRGTCMYILNRGVAKRLYDEFYSKDKINDVVDWWFNHIREPLGLKYYFTEPTLVLQASEMCIFPSSLR